jgi:hypothetical protein
MSTAPQPNIRSSQPVRPTTPAKPTASTPPGTAPPTAKKVDDPRAKLRRSVYAILITLSVGAMVGRVLGVNSVDLVRVETQLKKDTVEQEKQKLQGSTQLPGTTDRELEDLTRADWQKQRPFLSANDRSRWLTVRSLVEYGTYAIDRYEADLKSYPNWDTIDMVMHPDAAGTPHLYSSKPPLLATLYAGPYWLVYKISGAIRGTPITLGTHPYEIDRAMLLLVNVLPLIAYFWVLTRILERYGCTDWGRIFVMATAAFGTFITTFAVVLNNHLPGAVCTVIALYTGLRIWYDGQRNWKYFLLAGFFGAFSVACELPALSFFAVLFVAVLWKAPRQALIAFLPAALIVVGPYFATNWLAHGNLVPPYGHREHDRTSTKTETVVTADDSKVAANPALPKDNAHYEGTLTLAPGQTVTLRGNLNNWYDYEFTRTDGKLIQSYWRHPDGIDIGEQSIGKYALNLLVGHHGIFSLTPLWLLVLPGLVLWVAGKDYRAPCLATMVALISTVCILFFIFRPMDERNYGGMTSGFRWVFWLTPFWLLTVLPVADKLSRWATGRALCYLLLALSVLSATYPVWNPWVQPWLWNLWAYLGWV